MQGVWKALNEKDALRVKAIVDRMVNGRVKIDNAPDAYNALSVEQYFTVEEFAGWKNLRVILFAHYSKQNGDVMRDPEVMFLYKDDKDVMYPLVVPYTYRNDYMGKDDITIDLQEGTINTQKQRECKQFFVKWLDNIYEQQELKVPRIKKQEDETVHSQTQLQAEPMPDKKEVEETIEEQEKTVQLTEAAAEQPMPADWLIGDNYYESNPDNILGVPYKSSGRFGEVTKYKGTLEDVLRIQAETNFLKPYNFDNNPLISEVNPTAQENILKPAAKANVKAAIVKSKEEVNKRLIKSGKSILVQTNEGAELQTIYDIYNAYNPEISAEELMAFIWYRDSIGQRLSQNWYDVAFSKGADIDYMYSEETLRKWVEAGILCYYSGDQVKKGSTNLIPAYLYLAENIWHKEAHLKEDEAAIIETYGKDVYDRQKESLGVVFKAKYEKRLTIKGEGSTDGLILLPISEFSKKFMINTLGDEVPFFFKGVTAASDPKFGRPDFFHAEFITKNKWGRNAGQEFSELSLTDAFCAWLIKDKSVEFRKGTSFVEIIKYYIQGANRPPYKSGFLDYEGKKREDAEFARVSSRSKDEGDRLFMHFLNTQLTLEDRIRLESQWNGTFNSYVPINFNKVPVLFECAKYFRGEFVDIRPEKREAAACIFSEGAGTLAYGTGIGKTFSSIFSVAQFMYAGYCKRPLFVVPNQVYKQFLNEIKGLLPHIKIFALYNLSKEYLDQLRDEQGNFKKMPENSITLITYEGFENIGFNDATAEGIMRELYDILNQGGIDEHTEEASKKSEKKKASFQERLEKIVGKGLRGTMVNIEDLGFDDFTFDEAHKMKKVFTVVKGNMKAEAEVSVKEGEGNEAKTTKKKVTQRQRNRYDIQSGLPSTIALKGFMLSYYIQKNNNWGNVRLLTATPFTNSPLEIFSMLSFVAYKKLKDSSMNSLQNFFDTYIDIRTELVINAQLQPERRQVIMGFNNLVGLQQLIRRFVNYKGEKDVQANKPNKIVLPLLYKRIGDQVIQLAEDERVECNLPMTADQERLMNDIKSYVSGDIDFSELQANSEEEEIDEEGEEANEGNSTKGIKLDYSALSKDEQIGVRILRGMMFASNLALSPYLYEHSGMKNPTAKLYVNSSPKLTYITECIKSVKQWHQQDGSAMSGQIIYMNRGIHFFQLIKEYLIKEIGFKPHEVEMIYSGLPKEGPKSKSAIQNRFLGVQFNEETLEFEDIPDEERVKVVIGSSTIREGMNLQRHTSVLHDADIDWNPTDFEQLCGRAHRQGNLFNNVRITLPLMIDSMDIFKFQKLEEKTSRINTIWATDGKENVLKVEDLNPRELKFALIKNNRTLAQLVISEEVERLNDEAGGLSAELKRIENIKGLANYVEAYLKEAKKYIEPYREIKEIEGEPIWVQSKYLATRISDFLKKKTDKDGLFIIEDSELRENSARIKKLREENKISPLSYQNRGYVSTPYWWETFNTNQRQLNKEAESYLQPRGVKIEHLTHYTEIVNGKIEELNKKMEFLKGEENIKAETEKIRLEKLAKKIKVRTVKEVIDDFKKLNYLLGDKKAIEAKPVPVTPKTHEPKSGIRSKLREVNNFFRAYTN